MAKASVSEIRPAGISAVDGREVIARNRSKELFFAVVGPVGAGSSRVISSLQRAAQEAGYRPEIIKASNLIRQWATVKSQKLPDDRKSLENVHILQDLGDAMRKGDPSEVAKAIIQEIRSRRAAATGQDASTGEPVMPDEAKRIYLIDSIRHPAEINLLRATYGSSFALIGAVCEEGERKKRILGKYFTSPEQLNPMTRDRVDAFMHRDSDDGEKKYGQHVTEAFYQADFFLDNTSSDPGDSDRLLDPQLGRLVSIIAHDKIVRPTIEETAMHHAFSARVRSACLSRQVGASLVASDGTVVATGTNEVPAAGGGVYGERFASQSLVEDHRCAFHGTAPFCSNNLEQNLIIDELIKAIPQLSQVEDKKTLAAKIRTTRLGGLIEFSRAVHAEMDALLSASRAGISTVGTRMFVTTFPCHYCARHIVSAGVYEVQFIEPYPKSLALKLHADAIELDPAKWLPPDRAAAATEFKTDSGKGGAEAKSGGKVLFHPFVGVAPRMYSRAFEKTWQLKDKVTGMMDLRAPEWGSEWSSSTVGYPQLETALMSR